MRIEHFHFCKGPSALRTAVRKRGRARGTFLLPLSSFSRAEKGILLRKEPFSLSLSSCFPLSIVRRASWVSDLYSTGKEEDSFLHLGRTTYFLLVSALKKEEEEEKCAISRIFAQEKEALLSWGPITFFQSLYPSWLNEGILERGL